MMNECDRLTEDLFTFKYNDINTGNKLLKEIEKNPNLKRSISQILTRKPTVIVPDKNGYIPNTGSFKISSSGKVEIEDSSLPKLLNVSKEETEFILEIYAKDYLIYSSEFPDLNQAIVEYKISDNSYLQFKPKKIWNGRITEVWMDDVTDYALSLNLLQDLVDDAILQELKNMKINISEPRTMRATILFADISGYTRSSCNRNPKIIFDFLNDFYPAMHGLIKKYGGMIDKDVADEVMGIWDVPAQINFSTTNAVNCAIEMTHAFEELMKTCTYKYDLNDIKGLKVGLNTGKCRAGFLGSRYKKAYTVIGNDVNTAARLMSTSGKYCGYGEILIGEDTWNDLADLNVTDNYISELLMLDGLKGLPSVRAYKISLKDDRKPVNYFTKLKESGNLSSSLSSVNWIS